MGRPLSVLPPMEHAQAVARPTASSGWRDWLTALADLAFPPFCAVCRSHLGPGRRDPLCAGCWAGLERITDPVCRRCGLPFPSFSPAADSRHLCGACRRRSPAFAYARAAARYGDVVREAISAFKFGGRRALAVPLADLLAESAVPRLPGPNVDLVVPVPLHRRRERERGFNQAALLAQRLGWRCGWPVAPDVLRQAVPTTPQTELG